MYRPINFHLDKKKLSGSFLFSVCCLFCLLGVLPASVQAATYTVAELLPTPLDVPSVVNTVSWENSDTAYPNDDDKRLVNIGFPFTFKDTAYTQLRILTNGVLHFGADQRFHRVYSNGSLPTSSADRFIAPYWDDLVDDAQSSVTYGMSGTAPFRSFIVTWNNVRAYANNLRYDFQVVLYENGDIRFRYDNNTANGISATIGIEVDNSDFTQYSYNSSSVRTDFDLFFKNTLLNLPNAVLEARLDELEWTGAAAEVLDLSGNGLHGTVIGGALNTNLSPALAGNPGTCRYADFNGSSHYINIPHNNLLNQTGSFTVAAWIKIDTLPASGLKTIISKDENYEFHVKPNGSINWWWQTTSPNATQQFDSTGTITAGVWTHVAIRFQANNQDIFIDGIAAGSANFTGTPLTNSDPLQIGADQGLAGRNFNGDIDEVRVFDVALSDAQMVTLATETHFCALANPGCSAAFPDALSSHSDGTLTFTESGNLVNSPDNLLQFSAIDPTSNTFCNGVACSADAGNPVSEINFGTFPDTSSFSQDLTINDNQSGTLGNASQTEYDQVTVGQSASLNINTTQRTYYIDDLLIRRDATVNLQPGDYWIRRFRLERNVKINVMGSGTARLLIRDNVSFDRDTWLNANDGFGLTGDPGKLLIYGEGDISLGRNSRVWAGIYAQGDMSIDRDSQYEGGLTASNISINRNTSINYDAAAMTRLDFGNLCQGSSCTLGGFQITQPSVALACPQARVTISFQAMCDDGSTPKTDYAGTLNLSSNENSLSQFFAASSGGSAINTVSLNGSESGVGSVYLYHQNENNNLRVTLTDTAASISSTATQGTDFRSSGFAVTGPNDFICGMSETLTLMAIGQEDNNSGSCALLTGFSGDKVLSIWATANYEQVGPSASGALNSPIIINGTDISNSAPHTGMSVSATFSGGQATLNIAHLDAAQITAIEFAHDDLEPATAELRGATTAAFIVSPDTIKVTSTNNACTSNFNNCDKFVSAGSPFSMTAAAVCADATASKASSYRSNGNINLTLNLVAPLSNGVNGTLSEGLMAIQDADDGEKTITNQKVSEVGVFTISAQAPTFFGKTISPSVSENIGRFYADHFDLSLSSASFQNACNSFTYLDQDFFFASTSAPQLTIEAKNAEGVTTKNYEGDFWKLGAALQEQADCAISTGTTGFCYTDNVSGAAGLEAPNAAQNYGSLMDINGEKVMTLHDQSFDDFSYLRPPGVNVLPFDADIKLDIAIEDTDGATGAVALNRIGFSTDPDSALLGFNTTNNLFMRHGRWNMENAFGPETENLAIKAHAQYFASLGSSVNRFILNPDDNCTAFSAAELTLTPSGTGATSFDSIEVGAAGSSNFSLNSPLDLGEDENFRLSLPGAGNVGDVKIEVDLSSQPWLQYDWDADGSLDDHPAIKATFGQYRGHDRIIYWREVSN